ncbi:copper transport protein ATOX1-like [Saccostrea echinata]|uniref:copper transport protein ATOX1-like n=1 Tax=Saccostrea echinata TaxID=191078 RepID=UPI002A80CCA1|nr:copper transport protein ATOX1-like [Saccostrea echinata]
MSQTYEFEMAMTCEGCAGAAKRVLGKLGGNVTNVETNVETKKVKVTSSLSSDELLEQLKKTGKEVKFLGTV